MNKHHKQVGLSQQKRCSWLINVKKYFLFNHTPQLRILPALVLPKDKEESMLKFLLFSNAMDLGLTEKAFGVLATEKDKAHDQLLGVQWRGYTEGDLVPQGVKRFFDFFEQTADFFQAELFADDESFTPENFVQFFTIQVEIAQAKILELRRLENKTVANAQIEKLEEAIRAFNEVITKAKNAHLFTKLEVLEKEINA